MSTGLPATSPTPATSTIPATSTATSPGPAGATGPAAVPAAWVGTWLGHTRSLEIRADGTAHESIYEGCCRMAVTIDYRLRPAGATTTSTGRTIPAVITRVVAGTAKDDDEIEVGRVRVFSLHDGIVQTGPSGTTYCGPGTGSGACGA